jgi:uncharacterized protein (TIGR02246 family)
MTPEQIHPLFTEAFNRRDADALLACYEPDAVFVPEAGQEVRGRAQLRDALQGFLSLDGDLVIETTGVVRLGDLALMAGKWSIKGTGSDGDAVEQGGNTIEVARRQPDGSWLYAIDVPWEEGILAG